MDISSIPPTEQATMDRIVRSVTAPGATLDGRQRRQLAEVARGALVEPDGQGIRDPLEQFASVVTHDAQRIDPGLLDALRNDGLSDAMLVEVVALTAHLSAIDTFCFALGIDAADLPEPAPGQPNGRIDARASFDGGWLPTVGKASPPNALSMLPDDHATMHELHGAFYLAVADMADLDADRGLHRTQMELVAARTSLLNECFF